MTNPIPPEVKQQLDSALAEGKTHIDIGPNTYVAKWSEGEWACGYSGAVASKVFEDSTAEGALQKMFSYYGKDVIL